MSALNGEVWPVPVCPESVVTRTMQIHRVANVSIFVIFMAG
jgi:hypothetical protein